MSRYGQMTWTRHIRIYPRERCVRLDESADWLPPLADYWCHGDFAPGIQAPPSATPPKRQPANLRMTDDSTAVPTRQRRTGRAGSVDSMRSFSAVSWIGVIYLSRHSLGSTSPLFTAIRMKSTCTALRSPNPGQILRSAGGPKGFQRSCGRTSTPSVEISLQFGVFGKAVLATAWGF